MKYKGFDRHFLWGASSSAFQIEGAYQEAGKGLSIADIRSFKKASKQMDTKISVDHYHRWKEDIQLIKELGLKSYRFSINWTRIFPNGDEKNPNQKGLQFYHQLIDELRRNNIEPIVTIYHFDQPYHLVKKYGGWLHRESITDYFKYAKVLLDEFHTKVKYWLTINEQAVLVIACDMLGFDPSDLTLEEKYQKAYIANYHMWVAQAKIISYCKNHYPECLIGPAVSYITTLPATCSSEDMMVAKEFEDFYSFSQFETAIKGTIPKYFLNEMKKLAIDQYLLPEDLKIIAEGTANYIGINWYCTTIVQSKENIQEEDFILRKFTRIQNTKLKYTDWGWNCDPVGIRYALRQIKDRYDDIPIFITECGWSQKEELIDGKVHDMERIEYIDGHLEQISRAIQDGVNVKSFNLWSVMDLLSVGDGMEKRYGLIYVDRTDFDEKSMKRYKKDSFEFYKRVIKANS